MNWHPATNAAASSFYTKSGRQGRKMTGGSSKTAISRQLNNRTLRAWIKLFVHIHKRQPSEIEQRAALENPMQMAKDIKRFTSHKLTFRHGHNCTCQPCKDANPADGRRWSQHLQSWIDNNKRLSAERAKLPRNEDTVTHDQAKLIMECRIPKQTLIRYVAGLISYAEISSIFDVSEKRLRDYADAYGLL